MSPTNSNIAVRTATAAVIGGTASELAGGKFANGAVTSAFQHLFNAEAHKTLQRRLVLERAEESARRITAAIAVTDEADPIRIAYSDLLNVAIGSALLENEMSVGNYPVIYHLRLIHLDSMFYAPNAHRVFLISNGVRAFGGEINYYYQGIAGRYSGDSFGDVAQRIGTWNRLQGGEANLLQIAPATRWARWGYFEVYRQAKELVIYKGSN